MQLRPWIVLGTLMALVLGDAILIWGEEIQSVQLKSRTFNETDGLSGLRYSAAGREKNFQDFGLDEAGVKRALKKIAALEEVQGDRLKILLREADDQSGLKSALCGDSTADLAPRYGAMRYFVRQDGSRRRPLGRDSIGQTIAVQEWSRTAEIVGVYKNLEFGAERPKDATLMGVAAIFTRNEQSAITRESPWGSSAMRGWSWGKVKDKYGQQGLLEEDIIDYFALMHLVVELAQAEGGVCE